MPIPEARIRRGTPDDAPAIASVRVDTWRSAYRGLLPDALLDGLDTATITANWRRGLESIDPTRVAYVAEVDGTIVGFATGGRARSANLGYPGEIYALYVRDPHQGTGIGRALLRMSVKELVVRGLAPIVIWTLFANPAARGFYELLGGAVIGEKREPFEGYELHEVAYGWLDPAPLVSG
ncbi:MAG: GNAT family N-acetyltransferase [Chloroflexota bacterium]|nr:GNAT family N-acetyltransferase [Chloroflexota bacterium]